MEVINTRTDTALDRLTRVHKSSFFRLGLRPEWSEAQLQHYAEMNALLKQFRDKRAALEASPDWSPEGKAKRALALGQECADQLDRFKVNVQGFDEHIAGLKRKAMGEKPPSDLDRMLRYLQQQEIRQAFSGKSRIEVQVAYERALDGGDLLMAEALESAPVPLLSRETQAKGQAKREALALGPYAKDVADLEMLREAMSQALQAARAEVEAAGGPPPFVRADVTGDGQRLPSPTATNT